MTVSNPQSLLRELGRDERLLWSGVPRRGVVFRPSDLMTIPFTLLWGGFAVFWEYSVLSKDAPFFFGIWGVPFVLIGLYMIVGRFFADAYLRGRTEYGVTSQRVIIVSGLLSREVKSLPLAAMADITLSEQSNRTGSIQFGPTPPGRAWMAGTPWPGMAKSQPPTFDLIGNVREVYDLIIKAQQACRDRTTS
ncbi:PH domain-containing protein [Dyella mobilis]|nr:PH domain-containing protein [Dyella mobilis]